MRNDQPAPLGVLPIAIICIGGAAGYCLAWLVQGHLQVAGPLSSFLFGALGGMAGSLLLAPFAAQFRTGPLPKKRSSRAPSRSLGRPPILQDSGHDEDIQVLPLGDEASEVQVTRPSQPIRGRASQQNEPQRRLSPLAKLGLLIVAGILPAWGLWQAALWRVARDWRAEQAIAQQLENEGGWSFRRERCVSSWLCSENDTGERIVEIFYRQGTVPIKRADGSWSNAYRDTTIAPDLLDDARAGFKYLRKEHLDRE